MARYFLITAFLLTAISPASAMCGGATAAARSAPQSTARAHQCMGAMDMGKMDMGKMDMGKMDMGTAEAAKPSDPATDPHAGMDMSNKPDGGMGCCPCCGGGKMDGKQGGQGSGGMCGKQASLVTEDGKNDPLLNDPSWMAPKAPQQSHSPSAPAP